MPDIPQDLIDQLADYIKDAAADGVPYDEAVEKITEEALKKIVAEKIADRSDRTWVVGDITIRMEKIMRSVSRSVRGE